MSQNLIRPVPNHSASGIKPKTQQSGYSSLEEREAKTAEFRMFGHLTDDLVFYESR